LLNEIIYSLPPLKTPMSGLLDGINIKETKAGKKESMWKDATKYPRVEDNKLAIQAVEAELNQELLASKSLSVSLYSI
jgi:DNA mismatch repair protein MSH3